MKKKRKHASIKQTNKPKPNQAASISSYFLSVIFIPPLFYSFFPMSSIMIPHISCLLFSFFPLFYPACLPACLPATICHDTTRLPTINLQLHQPKNPRNIQQKNENNLGREIRKTTTKRKKKKGPNPYYTHARRRIRFFTSFACFFLVLDDGIQRWRRATGEGSLDDPVILIALYLTSKPPLSARLFACLSALPLFFH